MLFLKSFEKMIAFSFFSFKFAIEKVPKNSDYTFPFCKASIGMVKLITAMLHICEDGWKTVSF